jgi:hypothetical protein
MSAGSSDTGTPRWGSRFSNGIAATCARWTSADAGFFDAAPQRLRATFDIARAAASVWGDLVADSALSWCRALDSITWTSPRPFGVGTTRTASSLRGVSVLHERFFRWEEGRRYSFYVEEASVPPFRRFAEDYLVEVLAESACRLTWTIAIESRPAFRLAEPFNRLLLKSAFSDTRAYYGLS